MIRTIILFAIAASLVTGCGIKPGRVDPPQGKDKDTFPRTYPDLTSDPEPTR